MTRRSRRATEGSAKPACCQSRKGTSREPVRGTDVMRQINTSACRSNSASAGRGLLRAPEVNGNWAMKTSPNTLLVGVVDGVFGGVVTRKLFVGGGPPVGVLGVFVGLDDHASPSRLGELGGGLFRDHHHAFALQLHGKLHGAHVPNSSANGVEGQPLSPPRAELYAAAGGR